MVSATMVNALRWIGFLTGVAAAVLWLCSARIRFPRNLADLTWDGDAPSLFAALRKQADLSAVAAICTAISVLCQVIAALVSN